MAWNVLAAERVDLPGQYVRVKANEHSYIIAEIRVGETPVSTSARFPVDVEGIVTGSLRPIGLTTGGKCSQVTVNDASWTAIPTSPLADRNAIAIQNNTGVELKLNYDNTIVGYVGVTMAHGSERFYNITDYILQYAKLSPGSGTKVLDIEELA